MGNCLVTKFKEGVNNDALEVLGTMRFRAVATGTPTYGDSGTHMMTVRCTGFPVTVSVTSGGYIAKSEADLANHETSVEILPSDGNVVLYFNDGNYYVQVSNKYDSVLYFGNNNTYSQPLVHTEIAKYKYQSDLIILRQRGQHGDVCVTSDISEAVYVSNLQAADFSYSDYKLNIAEAFGKCSSIYNLNLRAAYKMYGTIESLGDALVASFIAAGKTSDQTISIDAAYTRVTYQGNQMTQAITMTVNANGWSIS